MISLPPVEYTLPPPLNSTVQVYRTSSLSPAAPGVVLTLPHLLPVVVEPGVAVLISVNTGPQAVADGPGPSLRHSKDTKNDTKC